MSMYQCVNPTQYVKEDSSDYLIFKGNRFYVKTKYAGVVEITKKTFEELERKGMEVR